MDTRLALVATVAALAGAVAVGSFAVAQTPPTDAEAAPPPSLPPPPEIGPAVEAPPQIVKPKPVVRAVEPPVLVAPPPTVLRSPVAVLQVLDKVTAETLRFEAPIGRRIRYKTLVVEVKACETRDYDGPAPRASAYMVVQTRVASDQGSRALALNDVFHGWTFAFTPALRAVEHPVYDLWLVACAAGSPAA